MDSKNLFDVIKNSILNIDTELKTVNNKGVFFAPELYIAFSIGRDIYTSRLNIFIEVGI